MFSVQQAMPNFIHQKIVKVTVWPENPAEVCAAAARTCYALPSPQSPESYLRRLIRMGHESVIEHAGMTVRMITDRGVSHELVRHRIASYTQESTRYVDYSKHGVDIVVPVDLDPQSPPWAAFQQACVAAEEAYKAMLEAGATKQIARSVLPTALKTEIVMTANLREWRHIFRLRCDKAAHPQMRALMCDLLRQAWEIVPWAFFDIYEKFCGEETACDCRCVSEGACACQ